MTGITHTDKAANPNALPADTQNGSTQNVSHKSHIRVDLEGLFVIDGKTYDVLAAIFLVQRDTGKIAQKRLASVAKELWRTNRKAKMIVFFLNGLRAIRPSGGADARVEADDITDQAAKFADIYGTDPFDQIGIKDMKPEMRYRVYKYTNGKEKRTRNMTEEDMVKFYKSWDKWHVSDRLKDMSVGQMLHWQNNVGFILTRYGGSIDKENNSIVTKEYDAVKQGDLDQMIEGVKSQLSAVNTEQSLAQTDAEKYTKMTDETKEELAAVLKAYEGVVQAEASRD